MVWVTFGERLISAAGYDALMMELKVVFTRTGDVCLYRDVSEDVWYGLKFAELPDRYFQKCIRGRFEEHRL